MAALQNPATDDRLFTLLAAVAELADAHGLGPCEATRGGSNPLRGTYCLR